MNMPKVYVVLSGKACIYLNLRLPVGINAYHCFGIVDKELIHWTQYNNIENCSIRNCYAVPDEEVKTLLGLYKLSEDWLTSIQACGKILEKPKDRHHD